MHCSFRLAFALLLIGPSLTWAQPNFHFFEPVTPARSVQVIVHHGAVPSAPENSAAAIDICVKDFCEWAELEVRLTKDGRHVIIQTDSVDSITNGKGQVSDLTFEELKTLDAGSWFAARFAGVRLLSLREALEVAKGKVNLCLTCKRIDPKSFVEDVIATEMQGQVVADGDPSILAQVKIASKGALAGMVKYRTSMGFDEFVKNVAPAAVDIDAVELTAELCKRFHAAAIKVQVQVLGRDRDNSEVWGRVIDSGVDWVQTDDPAGFRFFDVRRKHGKFPVMFACHRGASRYAPENTIPAIREAAKLGADYGEIDIRTTKDGRNVLVHDGTVNRTTSAKGAVRDLSYDEITALSAGAWFGKPFKDTRVPSFDEGLAAFGDKMGAYLDAKDVAPETLIAAIQKYRLSDRHVVYQSSLDYCEKIRKLDPTVRTLPPLKRLDDIDKVAAVKPYGVDAAWSALSQEMIAECHRHGIKVFSDALGFNETVEQYRKAMGWGIDGIQTDYPLRVLRAIELVFEEQRNR